VTPAITLEELLNWSRQSAQFWNAHFETNPALLELPCSIDDSGVLQELVRHIWMAELRWAQCVSGQPMVPRTELPKGPLNALFGMHEEAARMIQSLLDDPAHDWDERLALAYESLAPALRKPSRRKALAHALLHSQRHWTQVTSLVREAGFPSAFQGDLIFSLALE
jgi:uncharacterized damage-inducible protein DinB